MIDPRARAVVTTGHPPRGVRDYETTSGCANAQRSPQQPGRSVRRRAAHESAIDGECAL